MDEAKLQLLDLLEQRLDLSVEEAAGALASQSDAFGPIRDAALPEELRQLARQHWVTLLTSARAERPVGDKDYDFARARAVQRAREMVPLAAQVRAYLVGTRAVMNTIAQQAGASAASRGAALELIGHLMDSVVVAFSAFVEAYMETVQGERADREADQWRLLDEIITESHEGRPELARRAAGLGLGLGLEAGHAQVVVVAKLETEADAGSGVLSRRWTAEAIGRATGRAAARTFIVVRSNDVVAVLDSSGEYHARQVLARARTMLMDHRAVSLTAGVGTPFSDLGGLRSSYEEAQRALRHVDGGRPIVRSPDDISLFEDLTASADLTSHALIPTATRQALRDAELRATLRAYIDADLNIQAAADTLIMHPNSVRYRLRRIAELTGRDPKKLKDLLELVAAARIIDREPAAETSLTTSDSPRG